MAGGRGMNLGGGLTYIGAWWNTAGSGSTMAPGNLASNLGGGSTTTGGRGIQRGGGFTKAGGLGIKIGNGSTTAQFAASVLAAVATMNDRTASDILVVVNILWLLKKGWCNDVRTKQSVAIKFDSCAGTLDRARAMCSATARSLSLTKYPSEPNRE